MDMMSGGVTTSCATESECQPCHDCKCAAGDVQRVEVFSVCMDAGECVQSRTEIAQREPAHGYQWKWEMRLLRGNLLTATSGSGRDTQTRFRGRCGEEQAPVEQRAEVGD